MDKDGLISWRKQAVSATEFCADPTSKLAINKAPSMMVNVGHVRARTSGSIITKNAHPFRAERADGTNIIGVHNGSLITGWRDKPYGKDFEVDSEWMIHMLALEGADAFEHFNGAFALVWYDTAHPDHLFMARNKDRPLCYMVTEDKRSMLGASEVGMLNWLAGRNRFKIAKDGPFNTPFYLAEGKIYKFSLEDLGNFEKFEFPEYKYTGTQGNSSNWGPQGSNSTHLTHWRNQRGSYQTGDLSSRYPNDDEFNEHVDPWDERFNSALKQRTRTEVDWDYEMQESILQVVKDELAAARYTLVPLSGAQPGDTTVIDGEIVDVEEYHVVDVDTVVDGEALDRAMHRALQQQSKSVEPPAIKRVRPMETITLEDISLLSTNTGSATTGEIKTAKELSIFGKVVEFKGIDFDESNSSCLGVFTMRDPMTGEEVDCDGEIRYLTRKVAEDLYIKRKSHLAIVIGFHKEAGWAICTIPSIKEKEFIYSSITPKNGSQVATN